jgi:hypothetical protein
MSDKKILYPTALDAERLARSTTPDFIFWCPGCKCAHGVWTSRKNSMNAIWTFNGNMDSPTFAPSILIKHNFVGGKETCCHTFVRDGKIEFLGDCTHEFAGKTIPMEAF